MRHVPQSALASRAGPPRARHPQIPSLAPVWDGAPLPMVHRFLPSPLVCLLDVRRPLSLSVPPHPALTAPRRLFSRLLVLFLSGLCRCLGLLRFRPAVRPVGCRPWLPPLVSTVLARVLTSGPPRRRWRPPPPALRNERAREGPPPTTPRRPPMATRTAALPPRPSRGCPPPAGPLGPPPRAP